MFCSIVLIQRITNVTTIKVGYVSTFITGEILTSNCFSAKLSTPKGVAAHLPPLLVLTYTYSLQCTEVGNENTTR